MAFGRPKGGSSEFDKTKGSKKAEKEDILFEWNPIGEF